AGTPKTASAVATGTADNYQIADSDGNVRISGAVVQGDPNSPTPDTLTMVNTSITYGQQVSLGAFVHEQPASTEKGTLWLQASAPRTTRPLASSLTGPAITY